MTVASTLAVALQGLEGTVVEVEADVASGLPAFHVVGLPDSSMLQARERVRSAAGQVGAGIAQRRIAVNLQPAYLPKGGSGFDLAIAVAVIAAQGDLEPAAIRGILHLGELGLDGRVRPVPGVLPSLAAARRAGVTTAVVPTADLDEARLVRGVEVVGAEDLSQVLRLHGCTKDLAAPDGALAPSAARAAETAAHRAPLDFADVLGQTEARRAAEVAAAGGHHLLLSGPPGAGKTMIASRIPGVLPPLSEADALEVSAVHSLSGGFDARDGLISVPPFEAPHHTATTASIVGGGSGLARPGAISRAHAGVLFLDEAPEFSARVLEALREPLETGDVTIHRARGVTRYPARFQLVMAANPCPCGHAWGRGDRCSCTPLQRRRYLARLSGPVLDRIDMRVEVAPVDLRRVEAQGEPSAPVAARVAAARARQARRFADLSWSTNAHIPGALLRGRFAPVPAARALLEGAVEQGRLTLRGHDRVLRVAWTLADLDEADRPDGDHVGIALGMRGTDR
ncbi:YifB family Mg chelatase-like AAA ATPase [Brachybacterium hainanense]|uniref:YifB family Mg chelatase-like AAA ATPase n=1 Tax=Brachybacterium hainanense TaxID=1541174 RepID=A0ABV6RI05_9MICO